MPIFVIDKIKQKNNQNFPLVDSNDLHGGLFHVPTLSERDNLPNERRKNLMLCTVEEDQTTYQLVNNNWVVFSSGSSTNNSIASSSELGVIKVGDYLSIDINGSLSVIQDSTHRFVTDDQINLWNSISSGSATSIWYTGSSLPTDNTGYSDNDFFLIPSSGDFYQFDNNNTQWIYKGSLKGPQGDQGLPSNWYIDSGSPSLTPQTDNDHYLNSDNGDIYSYINSSWTLDGNLQGPSGEDGTASVWFVGDGSPTLNITSNSDYYLDSSTGDIYKSNLDTNSWDFQVTLQPNIPTASSSISGLVKIGDGISINSNGKIFADEQTEENFTTTLLNKLNSLEPHPSSHSATIIDEDSTHRFVTDTQITHWDNKLDEHGDLGGGSLHSIATTTTAGFFGPSDKNQLVELWNQYTAGNFTSGTSSSADITIQDEGTDISTSIASINFVGLDVEAVSSGDHVDVYIGQQPVEFAPYIDTLLSNYTNTVDRYIAHPTSEGGPYYLGNFTDSNTRFSVLSTSTITYSTSEPCSFVDTTTSFTVKLLNPDGTLIASGSTSQIPSDGTYNINNTSTSVVISNWQTDSTRYKADVQINIDISQLLVDGGNFEVIIEHHNSSAGVFSFSQSELFYDPNNNLATIGSVDISVFNLVTNKYLSGVRYFSLNDSFSISLSDIDNINYITYPIPFINIDISDFGMSSNIDLGPSDLDSWANNYDINDLTYTQNYTISNNNYRAISTAAQVHVRTIDWVPNPIVSSQSTGILIDTFPNASSDIEEYFDDEARRIDSSFNQWDSTKLLEQDELMVVNGELRRQYGDWRNFIPSNTAIYDSSDVTQYYYRGFRHNGVSHSNGTFEIQGVTEDDLSTSRVVIDISLDGSSWFRLNTEYFGGTLYDSGGCRVNLSQSTAPYFDFTLGTGGYTDDTTGLAINNYWGLFFRLQMSNTSNVKIQSIKIIDWT